MWGFDREQQSSVEKLSFNKKLIKKNHLPLYEQEIVGVIFFFLFHHLF